MSKNDNVADNKAPEPVKPEQAKFKTAKRVAAVLLVAAVAVAAVILLMRLNTKTESSMIIEGDFVVVLNNNPADNQGKTNHFGIASKPGANTDDDSEVKKANDGTYVLIGQPLGNAWPTRNVDVRTYYNSLLDEKGLSGGLSGSANFTDQTTNQPAALIYTFYLNNTSETEPQTYRIVARLNHDRGQPANSTGIDCYEYLRLGLFVGNDGEADDYVRYFANKTMLSTGLESDHEDYRECLSDWTWSSIDNEGNTWRSPTYSDEYAKPAAIDICDYFTPDPDPAIGNRGLFDLSDLEIAPGKSRRITFVAYLEVNDPDCRGVPPTNQRLGFSLHVGL